ncbi:MAG: type 1 glutamine amidotransferase [Pirellulales bacterium]
MKRVRVLRHVANEALGNLETVLRAAGLALDVVDCFADDWPRVERAGFDPKRVAGLVVMGGTMNVDQTDRFGFLATEVQWVRAAVDAQLPTLGICLGAQMLAKALGAKVYPNEIKEIGWYQIELLSEGLCDELLGGSQPRETVFQWHGDTFDLPDGAVLLARGETCRHQAFRYGRRAWGLQFHPEMTAQMVEEWLADPDMCALAASLDYIDPEEIRRLARESLGTMIPFAERIFRGFAGLCRRQQ